MQLDTRRPLTYLITSGRLTPDSLRDGASDTFIKHIEAAVGAGVHLIQIREKQLTARTLLALTAACVAITRGTGTRLVVNDRADIARAAFADGVHLTTRSIPARAVRETFGEDFLIGVSAHHLAEVQAACDGGADFATLSPVYDAPSKRHFALPPLGLDALREAAQSLAPFPLLALGGVMLENVGDVLRAGAAGVAGIRLFAGERNLVEVVRRINGRE